MRCGGTDARDELSKPKRLAIIGCVKRTRRRHRDGSQEWARWVVSTALALAVDVHDDGSKPAMFDLRIGPADAPDVAIEVVGAVDPVSTETWNIGPARGPMLLDVAGDWMVVVQPGADIRRIKVQLPDLLRSLESQHLTTAAVDLDDGSSGSQRTLSRWLVALGIDTIDCYHPAGEGKVHLSMPGRGGVVDTTGSSLPGWAATFLADPERADVVRKLRRSGARRREVFVPVTLDGAPWSVVSYLTGDLSSLPSSAPQLPIGIEGFWACPTHGDGGVYWNGGLWQRVRTRT